MNCKDIATLSPQYLSGELDTPRSAAFAEHLRACHNCATELEQQTRMDVLLRNCMLSETIDTASLDQSVRQRIALERPAFSLRPLALIAGIAATLLVAFVAYRMAFIPATLPLCAAAARDHFKEVTSRQHRNWLTDSAAIAGLAQRNGLPASLVVALTPAGYHLEHAKLCRLDGRLFLHVVYAQGTTEISTYLRPRDTQPLAAAIHQTESGHEHIAYFQTNQLTAMFVTDQSSEAALSFAQSAARLL
jgi:anti-sigma factor RsiW